MINKYEIFTDKSFKYLSNKMSIDTNDLTKKIMTDVPKSAQFFNELIEFIITLELSQKNRDDIDIILYEFFYKFGFSDESNEHFIFDNIRHMFLNYYEGGLLRMYQYREAEVWYPKVIIKSFLGIKEDIDMLDNEVIIYRGTSKKEYVSKAFGQSWTTEYSVAYMFAFEHYKNQLSYHNTTRVVIKSKVKKEGIYYYKKNGKESEVIIDTNMLNTQDLELIEEKLLYK